MRSAILGLVVAFSATAVTATAGATATRDEAVPTVAADAGACEADGAGRTCYWVCEYTLYTSFDACLSECGLCDRFCI